MASRFGVYIHKFVLALIVAATPVTCANAQTALRLELGDRGMARATVTMKAQPPTAAPGTPAPAIIKTLVLPFDLDATYRISKRDDVEVAVLLNGDGYCVLSVMLPKLDADTTIRIENAFNLVDERAQNRVKLSCDTSFSYLKQHRGVLGIPTSISQYDITISLPKQYQKEQLSFEPARDKWKEDDPGRTYTLPSGATSPSTSWIAFPSPFESGFQVAQIVISLLIGVFMLALEGKLAIDRNLGARTLVAGLVLTIVAIAVAAYFTMTLAKPLEFLAWSAGALIPLCVAPFICGWLLIASRYEAEISGSITINGERARYVMVSLLTKEPNGEVQKMQANVNADGSYRFLVLCGEGKQIAVVAASASGTSGGRSEEFEFNARDKIHVPALDIRRIEIRTKGDAVVDDATDPKPEVTS